MPILHKHRRGQALVMVTLTLFAMVGMLGLGVDLGWSYFVKKSAQSAADAASLAAVGHAYDMLGEGPYVCGSAATCQADTACPTELATPPTNNINSGCLYARGNGFENSGKQGRQTVTMTSGTSSPPPDGSGCCDRLLGYSAGGTGYSATVLRDSG